jgi:putative heme-binding domain-containing protein
MAADSAIRVRLQAAVVLGEVVREDPEVVTALVALARRDGGDPWVRLAILGALGEAAPSFVREWSSSPAQASPISAADAQRLLSEVAAIVGVRGRERELRSILGIVSAPASGKEASDRELDERLALAAGLGEGLERGGASLHAWLAGLPDGEKTAAALAPLWERARALVVADRPAERRQVALEALVRGDPERAAPLLLALVGADQPPDLQVTAARAAGRMASATQVEAILERWGELALGTRRSLLAALSSRATHVGPLVDALEAEKVAVVELDAASREGLRRLADPDVRQRLERLLARFAPSDRSAVVERYRAALSLSGDRARGAAVFQKNCQSCHDFHGKGHRVGPELSGIAGRLPEVMLSDILHPNRDVAPDFVALSIATKGGQVLSGLLVEETATGVKLRQAEGVEQTVLRSEIAEIRSSGRSLMPEGLEQAIRIPEMADLLAFLRSGAK